MAVGDFIKVDTSVTTAVQAPDLLRFIRSIRQVVEEADKVKGMMDHMTTAQIETQYGLAAGQGATVQTLVTGSRAAVRSASTLEIIDRVA